MISRNVIAAACLILFTPSLALAQTPATAQPMSLSAIEQRLASDGFRVIEIERYPNSVEVKGYDRTGQCTEMHLDRFTGGVLRRERDDDCGRSDRSDDDDHRGRRGHR